MVRSLREEVQFRTAARLAERIVVGLNEVEERASEAGRGSIEL